MPFDNIPKAPPADPTPPIGQSVRSSAALAPMPVIDRYPTIIGQGLSLSYVAACYRTCITGYRQQLVDLLDELLEREPHGYGVLWKRILGVAGSRISFAPPDGIDKGDPDFERAQEISGFCERQVLGIPKLRQHLASLLWATYYALAACEIHWDRRDFLGRGNAWVVRDLGFIHSRRLSYPDQQNWDLYIWDQGTVLGYSAWGQSPTNSGVWGLRIADYPCKFIVHAPQVRGDYPTREGVGRQLAEWFVLKRLAARMGAQYLERFGKPLMDVAYTTQSDGKSREATDEDILSAQQAAQSIGAGSMSGWAHPDSLTLEAKTPDAGSSKAIGFAEWLAICNAEISKPVLGNTLTTDVGKTGGNRALGDTMERGELRALQYDAMSLMDTLREQLIQPIVRLNFGADAVRLAPVLTIHIEDIDPRALMTLATEGAKAGIAVDGDQIAADIGLPTVPNEGGKPRRMVPLDVTAPSALDPELLPEPPEPAAAAPIPKTNGVASHEPPASPPAPPAAANDPPAN